MPDKENNLPEIHLGPGIPAVQVLHCDDAILALNKPAGLLTVPDRYKDERPNIMGLLHAAIKKPAGWAAAMHLSYVANAHRLDFDTSGVFIVARTRAALTNLVRQFRERKTTKCYLALVRGRLPQTPLVIDEPILPDPRWPGRAMISRRGRPSVTRVEAVQNFRDLSLVRAWPETGRLHQVRIHLKHVGCPIVCDRDYHGGPGLLLSDYKRRYSEGFEGEKPLIARQALHAESLELDHPVTGARLRIEAPVPRDLAVTIKQLTKYASA